MLTGSAIGFLVWAGLALVALADKRLITIDFERGLLLLFALMGSGAAIGYLVS